MSRTLKDRPRWVKINDKKRNRVANHDHVRAGNPVYRWQPVTDEDGNPVYETYQTTGFLGYRAFFFGDIEKIYSTFEEMLADNYLLREYIERTGSRRNLYAVFGDVEKTRVKTERVIIGYRPTECTIDDYRPRPSHYDDNVLTHLCEYDLARWDADGYRCSCCDGSFYNRELRALFHRGARSNENIALHKLKKEARAGYEYADDDYEDTFNRRKRFRADLWD